MGFWKSQTLPGHTTTAYRPFYEVDLVESSFAFSVLSSYTDSTDRPTGASGSERVR